MLRTHYSSQISAIDNGKHVAVAGWVQKLRDLGKVKFIVLRDREGEIQVTIKGEEELVKIFEKLSRESVISVSGVVSRNGAAPGGREIVPESIVVLSQAEAPLPLETDPHIQSELDTRIDFRYLDLRKKEIAAIFRIKDVIYRSFIDYLEKEGFVLAHTPCIVAAATEGGTNLFPIAYFDQEAFLGQSPQLYKQMLMASGLDKVMIITPAFRAEEHNTTRHLNEVMQLDIETAFVENEQDALKYAEGVIHYIYGQVRKECAEALKALNREIMVPPLPFKQLSYDDALKLLKKDNINVPWGEDLSPEAERALCKHFSPVIVTKWPTDVRAFYSMPEPGNEKICRAYDMLIEGMEAMSGAQRIHNFEQLIREMKRRKMNPKNFEFYTNAFRYGMPPHAGWSFGLERLTMLICGLKNVREATLWPRDRTRLTP